MTDSSLSWARRARCGGLRLLVVMGAVVLLAAPVSADSDDDYNSLPDDIGRDEVYSYCAACHSIRLVTQQGLSRERWDETLDWMIEEQGMAELDAETHKLILDYLSKHLNIDHRPAHVKARP